MIPPPETTICCGGGKGSGPSPLFGRLRRRGYFAPGASSFFHVEKGTKKTPALQAGRLIMVPFFRPRHGLAGRSCCGPLPGRSVSFGVQPYQ